MNPERRFWPFEISAKERASPHKREQIAFLEKAFAEGYCPYVDEGESFGICSEDRGARIIPRGRQRWEVVLGFVESQSLSAFVATFNSAAGAALDWVRGCDIDDVATTLGPHLAVVPKGMNALSVSHARQHGK